MFTGIIEEIGKISDFKKLNDGAKLTIGCHDILSGTKIGDSIAINGCCQTVTAIQNNSFDVDVSYETLKVTAFPNLKTGDSVNLERALTLNSRLGGHIVQGHIDSTAKFVGLKDFSHFVEMNFEINSESLKYIVKKGSITVNGVSLTVADIQGELIKIAVIPHTYKNTTLSLLKIGDYVNIETDILGRYIEKFLSPENNKSKLTEDFLKENGFY